jgi:hypothetical protein
MREGSPTPILATTWQVAEAKPRLQRAIASCSSRLAALKAIFSERASRECPLRRCSDWSRFTAGRALPPKSSETARPVDALFSGWRWVAAIGPLLRY